MSYADKPWLKGYMLGPYKLEKSLAPYPKVPLFTALDNAAENYPGQTAVLFEERKLSYKNLRIQAEKLAAALAGLGVKKRDRVQIFLPNCTEFIVSDWAILKAGACVVPTSIMRTDKGLLHEAESSKSRVIICREEHLERVLGIKDKCDIEHIIVTSTDGYDIKGLSIDLPKGAYEFRKVLEDNEPTPPRIEIDPMEDMSELAFTGGSTGVPKGVMITHFNRYTNFMQSIPWMLKPLSRGIIGKSSFFITTPLFHAYGHFIQQVAAYMGLRIILMADPRDNEGIVETMKKYRPLLVPTVPTQLMRMAKGKVGRMNVMPMSCAAPLPEEISEAIKKEIGNPVSEAYGLTETGPVTHINVSAFSKVTGFMKQEKRGMGIPVPDTDVKLVDPETGKEVPFGETGEIMVRGPQVMKGFWPEPGSGFTEGGWLHTGDLAYMDEDGYFFIQDRTKDMINVSGLKVYSTSVDEVLFKHPGVLMGVAVGVPDPNIPGSERVLAVVRLRDEYKGKVTAEDIINTCKEHLPRYAVPKYVDFKDDLPLTVTEKLFKKEMRDEAVERMKARGELK
ncbi:MAG: AMP-binding protein [Desulfobacteraceae bacterium]|nr:AMP-binding protein [Desulfobacteraceae bacterium]